MNKNTIILIVLIAVMVAIFWFYAVPNMKKYGLFGGNQPAQQQGPAPGAPPGAPTGGN